MSHTRIKITVDQIQPGMFVSLSENWLKHPFVLNNFKIKNDKQIRSIKEAGIKDVYYLPEKSDRPPLPLKQAAESPQEPLSAEEPQSDACSFRQKQDQIDRLKKIGKRIERCRGKYRHTMAQMPNIMANMFAANKEGVEQIEEVVGEIAGIFLSESEALVHLMSLEGDEGDFSYHFLNVSVLALMLGESLNLTDQEMQILGKGALLHDIGKLRIEKKYLRKSRDTLTKPERALVQRHPEYGVEILQKADPETPSAVLDMVRNHHEYLGGAGYPAGLADTDIGPLSRIVTIANIYDNLTNHDDLQKCLAPHQALLFMFKNYAELLDMHILSVLVQRLGIYPPGSIVLLSNDNVAKVIATNPDMPLRPHLLIYDPDIPRTKAAILDIAEEPDIYIRKGISTLELEPGAYKYLNPGLKLSYYADTIED
jgi:putative nucleotidyltransferase with HDIG domain